MVSGNEITQSVDTSAAIYPVIADPNITFGIPPVALNLYGGEIRAIVGVFTAVLTGGIGASCTFLDKIPHPNVRQIARLICSAIGLGGLKAAMQAAIDAANRMPVIVEQCYQLAFLPLGNSWKTIDSGCKWPGEK